MNSVVIGRKKPSTNEGNGRFELNNDTRKSSQTQMTSLSHTMWKPTTNLLTNHKNKMKPH